MRLPVRSAPPQIDIWILDVIGIGTARTDLQYQRIGVATVLQVMAARNASRKARAIPGAQQLLCAVRNQYDLAACLLYTS